MNSYWAGWWFLHIRNQPAMLRSDYGRRLLNQHLFLSLNLIVPRIYFALAIPWHEISIRFLIFRIHGHIANFALVGACFMIISCLGFLPANFIRKVENDVLDIMLGGNWSIVGYVQTFDVFSGELSGEVTDLGAACVFNVLLEQCSMKFLRLCYLPQTRRTRLSQLRGCRLSENRRRLTRLIKNPWQLIWLLQMELRLGYGILRLLYRLIHHRYLPSQLNCFGLMQIKL